jgi:hypothetical protein
MAQKNGISLQGIILNGHRLQLILMASYILVLGMESYMQSTQMALRNGVLQLVIL